MIPQLNPANVNATGAYQLAMALAMLSMGIGAILRFLPSRKWKSEGRDLMKTAFEAVLLASSFMTAEFIIGYVNSAVGIPDWSRLLQVVNNLADSGWVSLDVAAKLAFMFSLIAGALDVLSKFIPVIATFIMHFFMAVAFSILSFFASLAVIIIVLSNTVKVVAAMAAHAYLLVAAGIALFGWKHTRALGISLLVFGLALFYGLPVILGFVKPAEPYAADPDEEARAKILLALTESSVPTKISVVSAGGKPLYFSYISMNSSVLVKDVPLNSTLIANITGGPLRNEKGDVAYHFIYGRFYNESYPRFVRCTPNIDPNIPKEYICEDYGIDYSRVKELRHQLYRNSTVRYVWYLGLLLPVRDNRVQVSGPSLMTPLIEIPSNIFEIAGSLHKAFGGLRSEDEYWDMVYGRSKPVRIEVPVVRELNQNATAFVLYNETNYRSWREVEGKREYTHNYTIPRVSEHCWVSRTEEYFDESCNCTKTRYYYKTRAEYVYETPPDDRLVLVLLPGTKVVPKVIWHSEFGGPAQGRSEPIIYLSSPSYPKEKGLILGYQPLNLKFNQGIVEERKIPEPTNEAANVVKGNPGRGSGTTRELEEPFQKEVTLSPEIEVWEIGIRHTRTIETGEQEGSCPSTPPRIEAWSWLGFSVENSEPWDPYKVGIFRWEEYSRTGEYEYRAPASLGSAPSLGAYRPSDPRLVHRFYEEDPREPASNLEKYDAPLLMRFGTPISQLAYIGFAFLITMAVADAVTMYLGGTSLGLVGAARSIAGAAGGLKLLSPFGISRYPLFGKGMADRAMKALEDRIWRDAKQKLKMMEIEAMRKNDKATLFSIMKFREADRAWKRAYLKKWVIDKVFPNGGWWIYNKIMRGEPQRKLERLGRERFDALSRLLPEQAVILQQLNSWGSKKQFTANEAEALFAKIKEQANKQLTGGWRILYPFWPLALMAHKEGRAVAQALIFGIGGKVPKGWIEKGYDVPLAHKAIGIGKVKVGDKEIPVPMEKARIMGRGFIYGIEHQKIARELKVVSSEELSTYLREVSGEEVVKPKDLLKSESLRELSYSEVKSVLEGKDRGELPVWSERPVVREDGKFEVMHADLIIRNDRLGRDPEIKLWRLEANEEVEIKGTTIERVKLSDFFPPEEVKQADEEFRKFAKERTHGEAEDWAWHGKIVSGGAVKSWNEIEKQKPEARSEPSENANAGAELKAGIEKAREEEEEGSREVSSRTRTRDLWGDGE
jgi:hypothetical protein